MAFVNLVGAGLWMPAMPHGIHGSQVITAGDGGTLDANDEEFQMIGRIKVDSSSSKTFGGGSSAIDWLPGASITFLVNSTLRVGVKKESSIDTSNGPAARATFGAAAFDVYKDLVGGTDTITSTTARSDLMPSGTPFTVASGDLICIAFHLTTTAGTPSVKIRNSVPQSANALPAYTLVTSGPTTAAQTLVSNVVLTFSDGTRGWLVPSLAFSTASAASGAIGNTNINGNIFRLPFPCKIDAIAAAATPSTNAANFALDLYSTPLGTPFQMATVAFDANVAAAISGVRVYHAQLGTPQELQANTDYAVGIRQTTGTAVTVQQLDVLAADHFKTHGMGAECYAAISTAGGTFAAQNSGKRRYQIYAHISAINTTGAGTGFGSGAILRRR